jgi:hypothetical protein
MQRDAESPCGGGVGEADHEGAVVALAPHVGGFDPGLQAGEKGASRGLEVIQDRVRLSLDSGGADLDGERT